MKGNIFNPTEDLSAFVMQYWTLEFPREDTPRINTIIPDGTMKLIFHYGDLYWHHPENGEKFLQPRSFLIGQLTKPYIVEPDGDTGTFVVRFHPNGFLPFATIPLRDMENKPIAIKTLYGKQGDQLEDNIINSHSTSERITIIESFLLSKLTDSRTIDEIIKSTVDIILESNGQISINELSQKQEIHHRQLVRKFSKTIGLSPKQLSKTIRLQTTLKSLLNQDVSKLTDAAYQNDFFDQSHFIKDFKEFTGYSPKDFYSENLRMSTLFDKDS